MLILSLVEKKLRTENAPSLYSAIDFIFTISFIRLIFNCEYSFVYSAFSRACNRLTGCIKKQ
nr:MAG TPA: hypothetical protein [Caudoviricetes sp.]